MKVTASLEDQIQSLVNEGAIPSPSRLEPDLLTPWEKFIQWTIENPSRWDKNHPNNMYMNDEIWVQYLIPNEKPTRVKISVETWHGEEGEMRYQICSLQKGGQCGTEYFSGFDALEEVAETAHATLLRRHKLLKREL